MEIRYTIDLHKVGTVAVIMASMLHGSTILSIITWVYSLLVQLVCLVFLCRSTLMTVMLASFFVPLLLPI